MCVYIRNELRKLYAKILLFLTVFFPFIFTFVATSFCIHIVKSWEFRTIQRKCTLRFKMYLINIYEILSLNNIVKYLPFYFCFVSRITHCSFMGNHKQFALTIVLQYIRNNNNNNFIFWISFNAILSPWSLNK